MLPRVLVVAPSAIVRKTVAERLETKAEVDACDGLTQARTRLASKPYELFITDLRLGPDNGLQLVFLADALALRTRGIVFDGAFDPYLASLVQAAGAFFEHGYRIAAAAPTYVGVTLPPQDRRDSRRVDRRVMSRGGRRAADVLLPGNRGPIGRGGATEQSI